MAGLEGFVEVSGYSQTDMQDSYDAGYQDCKGDLQTLDAGENKTYDAEEMGVVGWNKVEAHAQPKLMQKTITANGFYDASDDDDVDGYSSLEVAVPGGGGGGPFIVRFFDADRQTLLKTDANVPYGGSAHCNILDGTTRDGYNFKGWNPSPTNIVENMNCYPMYGDYVIDENETQDSWETICADNGEHYPIGTYKNLLVTVYGNNDINDPIATVNRYVSSYLESNKRETIYTASQNNQLLFQYQYYMVKVAEGEDDTTSTWLSTGCAHFTSDNLLCYQEEQSYEEHPLIALDYWRQFGGEVACAHNSDWETCVARQLLNGKVFNSLPSALQSSIKSVNKFTRGMSVQDTSGTRVQKETLDKIWIPSVKELHSFFARSDVSYSRVVPATLQEIEEINGIDYSANYMPTYPYGVQYQGAFLVRTNLLWNDYGYHSTVLSINGVSSAYNAYPYSYGRQGDTGIPFGFCL